MDVFEVLGSSIADLVTTARAVGMGLDDVCSREVGSLDSGQIAAVSTSLHVSVDELLAMADAPREQLDRRKAVARAHQDLQDAAIILEDRAKGAAHLMRLMCEGDGIGAEPAAALDMLADVLEEAADDVAQVRAELRERTAS